VLRIFLPPVGLLDQNHQYLERGLGSLISPISAAPRRKVNVPRNPELAQLLDETSCAMPWRCWFLCVWRGSEEMVARGEN